jgi:hypothetical protein
MGGTNQHRLGDGRESEEQEARLPDEPALGRQDEEALEDAFPDSRLRPEPRPVGPIYAVIPEEVITASPEEFTSFLESIFTEDGELEQALDGMLSPAQGHRETRQQYMRALLPRDSLASERLSPASLLEEVFDAFEVIDEALQVLHEMSVAAGHDPALDPTCAVVPDSALADPEQLYLAIELACDETAKLELLVRQARQALQRLEVYRLSETPPSELIAEMRGANHLSCLQYLVEFLHAIYVAAESFETLELPQYHIRDYLKHLYQMEDWDAMEELVKRLETAVWRFTYLDSQSS